MAADKKKFLLNAQKQVQKGQLDRAIMSFKAILKIDPNDVKVHNTLGDLFIRQNKKKDGLNEYLWVANYYQKDGYYLRGIAICQKILNIDPDRFDVRTKLAELYTQQKLGVEARKQYLQVADFLDKRGKVAEALEVFGKIADLDPGNLQVRIKLASMFEKQGIPDKAAREYSTAAEGCLKENKLDKAFELLERAVKLSPTSKTAIVGLAGYHSRREEWGEVVSRLEPLVSAGEADGDLLAIYADAAVNIGKLQEAIAAMEKAVEQDPSSFPAKNLLGKTYLKGGETAKAIALFGPIVTEFMKEKKIGAAENLGRQLAEAAPESDKAQQVLLEIAEGKGDKEEAFRIHSRLADICEAGGDSQGAVAALEKALRLQPDSGQVKTRIEILRGGAAAAVAPTAPPDESPFAEAPLEEGSEHMLPSGEEVRYSAYAPRERGTSVSSRSGASPPGGPGLHRSPGDSPTDPEPSHRPGPSGSPDPRASWSPEGPDPPCCPRPPCRNSPRDPDGPSRRWPRWRYRSRGSGGWSCLPRP